MKSCETCKHWKESMTTANKPYQARRGECGFDFETIACFEYPTTTFGFTFPTKPTDGENCPVWSAK